MTNPPDPLAWLQRADQRVKDAEAELAAAREERREAMREAHAAGVTLSAIGRVLGVTRQRVMRVLRGE